MYLQNAIAFGSVLKISDDSAFLERVKRWFSVFLRRKFNYVIIFFLAIYPAGFPSVALKQGLAYEWEGFYLKNDGKKEWKRGCEATVA